MLKPFQYLIESVMIPFLSFSYSNITPNYGIAIILLTLIVKFALLPLTQKQFKSMKRMQEIHPLFKKLQEKHKSNPQKMQQETLKLYKEHNVNPFSGCLPMLVQLPFLFSLYYTMTSDSFKSLIAQPNVFPGLTTFWLPKLTDPDNFYILPFVIGVATYFSQKFMPSNNVNPQQQKIMAFFPVLMVAICWKMPAGVLLYWASSQIFSMVQQGLTMKQETKQEIIKGA